jgi:hypothetical protein
MSVERIVDEYVDFLNEWRALYKRGERKAFFVHAFETEPLMLLFPLRMLTCGPSKPFDPKSQFDFVHIIWHVSLDGDSCALCGTRQILDTAP